jgi:hypothetical protein
MKREHEYRAWDGHKMYYASLDDLVFSMGSQGAGDWTLVEQVGEELAGFAGQLPHQTTMIYMDSIGMKDKHGKKIYEGDIIQTKDGGKWRVAWHRDENGMVGWMAQDNKLRHWYVLDKSILAGEVIEHIYDRPLGND